MDFLELREPFSAWSHCTWLVLSIPGALLLWRRARGDRSRQLSLLTFALSLTLCSASSTAYHGARVHDGWLERLNRVDHASVFVLIAGTYTPVAWTLLRGRGRGLVLASAWGLAAAGALRVALLGALPTATATALYLAMGWGAVCGFVAVARVLSLRAVAPLILGGVLYSAGAAINLAGWPAPWPGVVGPHELFHLFVMGGSLCHFGFMLHNVAPFVPGNRRADPIGPPTGPRRGSGSFRRPARGEFRVVRPFLGRPCLLSRALESPARSRRERVVRRTG